VGTSNGHVPDLKWVNLRLPIRDVCKGLRFGPSDMIHCWHPDRLKNGDHLPSVSIKRSTNRVQCLGCGSKTPSVVDLVVDVESTVVAGAARWRQRHFGLKQPLTLARIGERALLLNASDAAISEAESVAEQTAAEDPILGELQRQEVARLRRALELVLPELQAAVGAVQ
jgi:hypothetical protein